MPSQRLKKPVPAQDAEPIAATTLADPAAAEPTEETIEEETIDEPDTLNENVHEPSDPDGVIAKEQEEFEEQRRKSRAAAAAANREPEQRYKPKRRLPLAIFLLILFLLLAVAGFWYMSHHKPNATHKTTNSTGSAGTKKQSSSQTPAVPTKNYDSSIYTLAFDYPENWKVSDTAAKLTVTSPGACSLQQTPVQKLRATYK